MAINEQEYIINDHSWLLMDIRVNDNINDHK